MDPDTTDLTAPDPTPATGFFTPEHIQATAKQLIVLLVLCGVLPQISADQVTQQLSAAIVAVFALYSSLGALREFLAHQWALKRQPILIPPLVPAPPADPQPPAAPSALPRIAALVALALLCATGAASADPPRRPPQISAGSCGCGPTCKCPECSPDCPCWHRGSVHVYVGILPWRNAHDKQLQQLQQQLQQLQGQQHQAPAPAAPAPQIIQLPPAQQQAPAPQAQPAPLQVLPIAGPPLQVLPIAGAPQQSLPISGQPLQVMPIAGNPHLLVPINGQPLQALPIAQAPPPASPPQAAPAPLIPAPAAPSPALPIAPPAQRQQVMPPATSGPQSYTGQRTLALYR